MPSQVSRNAYATIITAPSYIAGVVILAYTLRKAGSIYPLVVLYTNKFPEASVAAIAAQADEYNIILRRTETLLPKHYDEKHLIAERFADTWTKLRVFELFDFDLVCQLDSDMIVLKDMDQIFSHALHGGDWLIANHACVCNIDKDPWAPQEWTPENCAYSLVQHPKALTEPTQPKATSITTHHSLNSGMFLFRPSSQLWDRMMTYFDTCPDLEKLKFPDQDFLSDFFHNKWTAVGWQYNALKTMRYTHPSMWRDGEVRCLHYIVDKPWTKRIGSDGIAGYQGQDGETHRWWWDEYAAWRSEQQELGAGEVTEEVEKYIAKPLGQEAENSNSLRAIGSQVQSFASEKRSNRDSSSVADQPRL